MIFNLKTTAILMLLTSLLYTACGGSSSGDSEAEKTYAIGDVGPSGAGKVFYVSADGKSGMEVASPVAVKAASYSTSAWITGGSTQTTLNGKTSTDMGTGLANSNFIVAQTGQVSSAAKLCRDFKGGGFTDWYLPSKDELDALYPNMAANGGVPAGDAWFWSSSESGAGTAWAQGTINATYPTGIYEENKGLSSCYVIAVRTFGTIIEEKTYAVGDTGPSGVGTVYYVTADGKSGLEAAPEDWNGDGSDPQTAWITGGSTQSVLNGKTKDEMGTGLANSNFIIAQSGHASSAAKMCRDYDGGGLNDWYLPSKNELVHLYVNREVVEGITDADWYYWSSSESTSSLAWAQEINPADNFPSNEENKNITYHVRPVRVFGTVVDVEAEFIYKIGYRGPSGEGTVFFVTDGGRHGLEAAPSGWSGSGTDPEATEWITGGTTQETANTKTLTTIGSGLANSNFIIAQTGHTASAAKMCRDYTGGSLNDWFLPSKDELSLLYAQRTTVGGITTAGRWYWSSSEGTEYPETSAWAQGLPDTTFTDGKFEEGKSMIGFLVRPIRKF